MIDRLDALLDDGALLLLLLVVAVVVVVDVELPLVVAEVGDVIVLKSVAHRSLQAPLRVHETLSRWNRFKPVFFCPTLLLIRL